MASSIFCLFHGCREDLWHPKALGFFALKLLLATVRALKGAARGLHSAEDALVAAFCVSCLERSVRSVSSEYWRNTSIPPLLPCDCCGEAPIWYCPGLSWYHCGCPPALFVCVLSKWMEMKAFVVTLLRSPQSEKELVPTAVCAFPGHPHHDEYHLLTNEKQEILVLFCCLT